MAEVVSTNQFKNGMAIEIDGDNYTIVEFQHVKPGKGGAFVRTRVKSIATGAVLDKTFRAGEKFNRVHTQSRTMQFLYATETEVVLMDNETYEQISVSPGMASDALQWVVENGAVVGMLTRSALIKALAERGEQTPVSAVMQREFQQASLLEAAPSRRPWRPASPCRCPCSSTRASASRSTHAAAST